MLQRRKLRPREGNGFVQAHTVSQWQSWDESPDVLTAGSGPLPPCPHFCQSISFPLQPCAFEDVSNQKSGADRKSLSAFYQGPGIELQGGQMVTH